ncbi:MAG: DUF4145 domain-containing protein [Nocardioidaceae bacterium]
MSNFRFLRAEWPSLAQEAARAEHNAYGDPRASCFYARRALELAVNWLYDYDRTLQRPYRDDLSAMLFEPTLGRLVGNTIRAKMDIVRRQGNAAVHKNRPVTSNDSVPVVRELFHVLYWLASQPLLARVSGPAGRAAVRHGHHPKALVGKCSQAAAGRIEGAG